jgi:hypothetical protein
MKFWKNQGFRIEPASDHFYLRWKSKLHTKKRLQVIIPNLCVNRTPKWKGWDEVPLGQRPPPPQFGTEQQANFGVVADEVEEKKEADENRAENRKADQNIAAENKAAKPGPTQPRWWKTRRVGDKLTEHQLGKYRQLQCLFLDNVHVPGQAPAPERLESQVFRAHHTLATIRSKYNNGPPTYSSSCWTVIGKTNRMSTFEFGKMCCTPVKAGSQESRQDLDQDCFSATLGTRLDNKKQNCLRSPGFSGKSQTYYRPVARKRVAFCDEHSDAE